jgi:hypothetical protein
LNSKSLQRLAYRCFHHLDPTPLPFNQIISKCLVDERDSFGVVSLDVFLVCADAGSRRLESPDSELKVRVGKIMILDIAVISRCESLHRVLLL